MADPDDTTVEAEHADEDAIDQNTGTPQAGTPQAGTPQAGTPQVGTPQVGTPRAGTPQAGTPQAGTPQVGTPQAGTPQAGTPQAGTPQVGTPQAGTPQAGSPRDSLPDDALDVVSNEQRSHKESNFLDDDREDYVAHRNTPSPANNMQDGVSHAPPIRYDQQDFSNQNDGRIPTAPPMPESEKTEKQRIRDNPNALNLVWSFGMSMSVPVINLSTEDHKLIAYACGHTGILYNMHHNSQMLLQGHANVITCMCTSSDHRWLATADIGPNNMIIVWDTSNAIPVKTIFDPHPEGAVAMAMTPDARYLVSVSIGSKVEKQTVAIWDWTVESDTPLCTAELSDSYSVQSYIHFNPADISQLVSNSETQVIFYTWRSGQLEYYTPPLSDVDFNKPVGKFSHSIFLGNTSKALTATSIGNLVVWDTKQSLTSAHSEEYIADKKALKLVKLQERGLTVLTTCQKFIVTGDVAGHVKFFDHTLKLVNWYQDLHVGPINAISFTYSPDFGYEIPPMSDYPKDATIRAATFIICDFVLGSTNAVFAHCTTDGTDVKIIHRDHNAQLHAIDAHPAESKFVVGSYSGLLKIWDYGSKEVVVSRMFERGQMIHSCSYDPKGVCIAVGFTNGNLRIVDAITLDDQLPKPYHYSRDTVTHIAFSHDSSILATADAEYTTTVYKYSAESSIPYVYIGRYRAHYKPINSLLFGKQLDGEAPRLLSLGEDGHLVEYEVNKGELCVLSCDKIEQSATPCCMTWYPPITKESFILTANNQFKLKLYNCTTKMCRKTLLGPTYGSPVQQMLVLPTADPIRDKRYLAYITENKIGLHILPLDGNPHNAMALNSHPLRVSRLVSSHDGKYLFTAGGSECIVNMWCLNINALEAQAELGGSGLTPFYGLLDGGHEGELFRELEDYFYYAQIRSQGVDTADTRNTSKTMPVSEISFVARALGFYPSEQEIEDMKNEVKYRDYVETGQYTTEIDLGDFIKLYINHRPVFGLEPSKLEWAFQTLGLDTPEGCVIDRGELLDILQNRGEHMKEYDLAEYLMTLLGYTEEGGSSELQEYDTANAGSLIDQSLPQDITSQMFADDLLGFGIYDNIVRTDQ